MGGDYWVAFLVVFIQLLNPVCGVPALPASRVIDALPSRPPLGVATLLLFETTPGLSSTSHLYRAKMMFDLLPLTPTHHPGQLSLVRALAPPPLVIAR